MKAGFCGLTLPPAADGQWEKSHMLWLFPLFCGSGQTLLPIVRGQTMLPVFFSTKQVEVSAMAEQAVLFERQADLTSVETPRRMMVDLPNI
jgi:hypothetical protein